MDGYLFRRLLSKLSKELLLTLTNATNTGVKITNLLAIGNRKNLEEIYFISFAPIKSTIPTIEFRGVQQFALLD